MRWKGAVQPAWAYKKAERVPALALLHRRQVLADQRLVAAGLQDAPVRIEQLAPAHLRLRRLVRRRATAQRRDQDGYEDAHASNHRAGTTLMRATWLAYGPP